MRLIILTLMFSTLLIAAEAPVKPPTPPADNPSPATPPEATEKEKPKPSEVELLSRKMGWMIVTEKEVAAKQPEQPIPRSRSPFQSIPDYIGQLDPVLYVVSIVDKKTFIVRPHSDKYKLLICNYKTDGLADGDEFNTSMTFVDAGTQEHLGVTYHRIEPVIVVKEKPK